VEVDIIEQALKSNLMSPSVKVIVGIKLTHNQLSQVDVFIRQLVGVLVSLCLDMARRLSSR
jgi:hypothetical protein